MISNTIDRAAALIKKWRNDPVQMVREEFKAEPDYWQKKVLRALPDTDPKKQRIAMKANKGPGKTAVEAWAIWWFMGCQGERGEHPKGKATGITDQNLKDNLWPELSKWQQRSEYFKHAFTWTQTRLESKDHRETWFFAKQPWSKSGDTQEQANTLAGLHSKYIFFVLDESGGIPTAVMATAEAGLANEEVQGGWAKILQGGNPTHLEGPLYDACTRHRNLWYVITITGDPDDPKRSPRISKKWARQQIAMYGRHNPWVLVNVFGEFPPGSINTLLGPEEVEKAMKRYGILTHERYEWAQKRLGVDVARFGDDRTVLFGRQGIRAIQPVIMRGMRTTHIAARIMLAKERWDWEIAMIDDTGHWGHGVIDNLHAVGLPIVPVVFQSPAIDSRYANRRAEMYIKMAEWVRTIGCLPNIPELTAELTTPTYTFSKGRFQIEEKDQIKERLGRSPDLADALALTFAIPEQPATMATAADRLIRKMGRNTTHHLVDYDPLAEEAFV